MNARSFIAVFVVYVSLAISCTLDPVADFNRDNPLDPESSSYQGYPTVNQLSDVEVVWPEDESESAFVPLLTVSELLGATAYDFAIDTNRYDLIGAPDYTAAGLTSGGQPSNTLDLWAEVDASEGLPAGTYYWQAAVTDGSGTTGAALSGGRFTIVDVITDSDVLPAHDDAIADTSPELSWPAITGAGSYEVQTATIAADLGTGAGTEVTELVTGLSYEWPSASAVELGDSIYWRVRGVDENSREYTHWYGDFTIPVTAWDSISWGPLPSDGGTTTSRFPVIDWSDISDAVTYSIVTGLSAAELNTATPVTVAVSEYPYPYYVRDSDTVWWRVKAVNADARESAWSSDFSFDYQPVYNFDNGVMPSEFSGNWFVTTSDSYSGSYSATHPNIGDSQSSSMYLIVTIPADGSLSVSFYHRESTESNWDFLNFYNGSSRLGYWSGSRAWASASFNITGTPGQTVTLQWKYSKDGSVSSGSDSVWVDDIRIED